MKHLIIKDIKLRKSFSFDEKKILVKKFLFVKLLNLPNLSKNQRRLLIYNWFKRLNQKSSLVKIKSRCLLTNRGRSIYRPFNLSRSLLREFFLFGIIPGYKKAVW